MAQISQKQLVKIDRLRFRGVPRPRSNRGMCGRYLQRWAILLRHKGPGPSLFIYR